MIIQPAQDQWGALSIPTQPDYSPFHPIAQDLWKSPAEISLSDPTLCVVLDFFAVAINTDQLCQAAWNQVRGQAAGKPLNRIFLHNPGDVVFNTAHVPALYIWRESTTSDYAGDDWYRDTTKVKGLWVFPLAAQINQKARDPFVNALSKCMAVALERGRTPSWIQPSDTTDLRSKAEGTVFYPYAGFESFRIQGWKRSKLLVPAADKTNTDAYPAIEFDFEMEENLVYGLSRFFVNAGATATLYDGAGTLPWGPVQAYTMGQLTTPSPGNGFLYACTTAGTTLLSQPTWPTDIGDTVQDGSVVWTCSSTMQPNGNETVSGPLAP